jgi:hypothetical protein
MRPDESRGDNHGLQSGERRAKPFERGNTNVDIARICRVKFGVAAVGWVCRESCHIDLKSAGEILPA